MAAKKTTVSDVRRLTQEELLEEAKITEEINLRSLGKIEYVTTVKPFLCGHL